MDVLMLSRLQFAAATFFHFIFVPLTLGLSILVAIMETNYLRTGDEVYLRMTKFWGKMFVINFAIGVVTGITLEFQFGTNWSRYSKYVGDIFGSLLAIEATTCLLSGIHLSGDLDLRLEQDFPRTHAVWHVAGGHRLQRTSAVWILIANGWMQHPVGYVIRNGRAELGRFLHGRDEPIRLADLDLSHHSAALIFYAGFFVMGVSAYHLLRNRIQNFLLNHFAWA